jgi:hypothetical protein
MPRHGHTPDPQRRRQVAELRAEGLTFPEIGRRLGVSTQAARRILQTMSTWELKCNRCATLISAAREQG